MKSSAVQVPAINKRPFTIVLVLAVLLNIGGIGLKFFTDDPALYALIARNIVRTNDFTDLIYHGRDWLDKPHFPFWMIAISFKAFGVNTIAYKLPALLFFFMSVIYTFKLARKFYGDETALIAILILLTSQHLIMSNTDIRAEPYIMGLLMGSVYHFYMVKERFSWTHILLASLMAACAVMTKGIYLLIPIGFAIAGDLLLKRDFKGLLHWKWLLAITLTCIFTLPELYTLYTQFDLHPNKIVFGRTGISGMHWFLWDSQFGRFNNNSFIRNTHGNIFFFLHTLLWAFAPWAIVFFYALFRNIRSLFKGILQPEYVCFCGAIPMLLIFSISKFQLPFYTNILFPFFSIITAVFIHQLTESTELKFFKVTQYILAGLFLLVFVALNFLLNPGHLWVFILLLLALAGLTIYIYRSKGAVFQPVFLFTCCAVICVNAWFVLIAYPLLLSYRGDVAAAAFINKNYPGKPVINQIHSNAFDFYANKAVSGNRIATKDTLILADQNFVDQLKGKGTGFDLLKAFDNYPRENIDLSFIIPARRAGVLNKYYLLRVGK